MKVQSERDVDIKRLLIDLNDRSRCSSNGMAGYDVRVEKQLLRDAHDVIKQLYNSCSQNDNEYRSNLRYQIGDIVSIPNKDSEYYRIVAIDTSKWRKGVVMYKAELDSGNDAVYLFD